METNPQLLAMARLLQDAPRAPGDPVFSPQQYAAALAPATVNPNIAAQGSRVRANRATLPDAKPPKWLLEGLPMEGRATFLPFQDTAPGSVMNQRSLALPGIVAGAVNAFTAPGRAYSGSDPSFDPQYEAANLAMNMMGGGVGASSVRPQPRGTLGMNVWHGSPHKFDKFDASKIGTGEGAQAYGHGLYLAETPGVAKSYKIAGSDAAHKRVTGGMTPMEEFAYDKVSQGVVGDDLFSAMFQRYGKMMKTDKDFDAFDAAIKNAEAAKGHLYKVDLPDEHIAKMLDWDKPLSQQPAEVQRYFEPIVDPIRKEMAKPAPGWGDLAGPQAFDPLGQELLGLLRKRDAATAQDLLSNGLGRDVSEALRKQGIPGIRYLDGGSRGAGTGTSNFVVFPGNEGILKILERQ